MTCYSALFLEICSTADTNLPFLYFPAVLWLYCNLTSGLFPVKAKIFNLSKNVSSAYCHLIQCCSASLEAIRLMNEETDVCLIDNFPLSAARNHAAAAAEVVVPLELDLVQVRAQRPGSNLGLVEQEPKAR